MTLKPNVYRVLSSKIFTDVIMVREKYVMEFCSNYQIFCSNHAISYQQNHYTLLLEHYLFMKFLKVISGRLFFDNLHVTVICCLKMQKIDI